MTMSTRSAQARLLSGVGTAVLASIIATSAQAQSASTNVATFPDFTAVTEGHKTDQAVQTNDALVSATVSDVAGGITGVTDPGTQIGNSNEVEANAVRAIATGQTLTNFVDLGLINAGDDGSTAEGVATLGSQVAEIGGTVISTASGNALSLSLDGFQSGSAVNSGNTISAAATVNNAESLIAGTVPVNHASSAIGASTTRALGLGSTDQLAAEGTIVVSSFQRAFNTTGRAEAAGNTIVTSLDTAADNAIAGAPEVADNTISANFRGAMPPATPPASKAAKTRCLQDRLQSPICNPTFLPQMRFLALPIFHLQSAPKSAQALWVW